MGLKFRDFPSWGFIFIVFSTLIKGFGCLTAERRTNLSIKLGQPKELITDKPGRALDNSDFEQAANLQNVGDVGFARDEIDPIELAGFFEGDIILNDIEEYERLTANERDAQVSLRNAIINLERKWPNGKIPYIISAAFSSNERALIANAVLIIHNKTCIRFIPRKGEADYVHILKGDGCSSSVGRVGGPQTVSIGTGCFNVGIIMHELMHTTGFWHEHSRGDRDDYIEVIWTNIRTGMKNNFDQYNWNTIQSLGIEYDLGSIMHYGPYAFAKDRTKPTIIPKRKAEIGQRRNYSAKDLKKMNILYNCPGTSATAIGNKCVDSNDYCLAWAILGECDKNPTWMKKNCRRSCKECDYQKSCDDKHVFCDSWAKLGECTTNPNYMLIYCQFSCNSCL